MRGYSIHHLYSVTVGDKTWAQHRQNPINSDAEVPVNEVSPTKKETNCLRTATKSDAGGESFYPETEDVTKAQRAHSV